MSPLALLFGVVVGFSLGLTGGGGSIFAVPLLVHALGVPPREAIGISLGAVGATALVGCLARLRTGEVELRTGLVFAVAGMLGAPVGAFLGGLLPASVLLSLFAGLMLVVAARMWRKATKQPEETREVRASFGSQERGPGPTCRRDARGELKLTSRCAWVLVLAGLATGVLSGLFGVGGGFVIVPTLVFVTQMQIRRAVATSLLVISLVSAAGLLSFALSHESLDVSLTLYFAAGGVLGLLFGGAFASRLSGPVLQKVFAVTMVLVATIMILKRVVP